MCYGHQRSISPDGDDDHLFSATRNRRSQTAITTAITNALIIENLQDRLAETEARLERARAREAELSHRLEEMKRFVTVMEILETFLKRRFREQQEHVALLLASLPAAK
ncbi:protein SKIP34 [Mercurialis annua]|uniref:protein SKIP34 n=1 Tax=Mercurialis annua TaxID=3986 RepID=UPI00215E45EC|nr:protein SKIP34 [Mercurialis annua]